MPALPVVYHDDYLTYNFGPGHPFTPVRWEALQQLLAGAGLPIEWIIPEPASDESLCKVHSREFVDAVKAASGGFGPSYSGQYGLETGDVPVFRGMHDASSIVAGGSLRAGELVASGQAKRALQLGGGLHHAMRDRASGFCVYNDLAVLVQGLRDQDLRIAYVDIDVHHGDGVQAIFYDDADVLTVSLHESGRYLFPGTGFVDELGRGAAQGTSINLPLFPETKDASFLEVFDSVVPDTVKAFQPDILVVQSGADAHRLDPLAHLSLTTHAYGAVFDRLIQLADDVTGGRIVVTLGGGYAFDSTLRIWSMLAYKLADEKLPEQLPGDWLSRWQTQLDSPNWTAWLDEKSGDSADEHDAVIAETNRETVRSLKKQINRPAS